MFQFHFKTTTIQIYLCLLRGRFQDLDPKQQLLNFFLTRGDREWFFLEQILQKMGNNKFVSSFPSYWSYGGCSTPQYQEPHDGNRCCAPTRPSRQLTRTEPKICCWLSVYLRDHKRKEMEMEQYRVRGKKDTYCIENNLNYLILFLGDDKRTSRILKLYLSLSCYQCYYLWTTNTIKHMRKNIITATCWSSVMNMMIKWEWLTKIFASIKIFVSLILIISFKHFKVKAFNTWFSYWIANRLILGICLPKMTYYNTATRLKKVFKSCSNNSTLS